MTSTVITVKEVCRKCGGTGIAHNPWYPTQTKSIGFVCSCCNGKGYIEHTYEPFVERKADVGVEHIFAFPKNEFHTIDITNTPEKYLEDSISYEDWLSGKNPPEFIKSFYCPYDIFGGDIYEDPCSRCKKCRKNASKKRYISDKAACWNEVETKMQNGEKFPK